MDVIDVRRSSLDVALTTIILAPRIKFAFILKVFATKGHIISAIGIWLAVLFRRALYHK